MPRILDEEGRQELHRLLGRFERALWLSKLSELMCLVAQCHSQAGAQEISSTLYRPAQEADAAPGVGEGFPIPALVAEAFSQRDQAAGEVDLVIPGVACGELVPDADGFFQVKLGFLGSFEIEEAGSDRVESCRQAFRIVVLPAVELPRLRWRAATPAPAGRAR